MHIMLIVPPEVRSHGRRLGQSEEFAWPRDVARELITWLSQRGYAVVGMDVWRLVEDSLVGFAASGYNVTKYTEAKEVRKYSQFVKEYEEKSLHYLTEFDTFDDLMFSLDYVDEAEYLRHKS